MPKAHHVYITGERSLIQEYGSLCLKRKQTVSVRLNPGESGPLPQGVRKAEKPPKTLTVALELSNIATDVKRKNLVLLDRSLPPGVPIISSSVTVTVAEQSTWIKNRGRLIGLGALPSLLDGSLIELARSQGTDDQALTQAREFVASLGKEMAVVRDTVGLVTPRILCMLANEAYFAMMEGVAEGPDIDTAMRLGTNYPLGPVERAGRIGMRTVCAVLQALHTEFGEDRYRVAPSLRQAALRET